MSSHTENNSPGSSSIDIPEQQHPTQGLPTDNITSVFSDTITEILGIIIRSLDIDTAFIKLPGIPITLYQTRQPASEGAHTGKTSSADMETIFELLITDSSEPIVFYDYADHNDPELKSCLDQLSAKNFVSINFTYDSRLKGFLCCSTNNQERPFRNPDIETLTYFIPVLTRQLKELLYSQDNQNINRKRIKYVIENECFIIYYQPIYHFESKRVVSFEALARFTIHPRRTPDKWLHEAAEVGLCEELELALIKKALKRLQEIPANIYLNLNISSRHIISGAIFKILDASICNRVVLEITEHESVSDYEALMAAMTDLRAQGLRLAIDDAGAGYSSFRHILKLKPDFIKLDMSITRNIDRDTSKSSLASALILFANETGSTVIAEGVETESEWEALRKLGATKAQGYLIGHPLPLAQALAASQQK